MFFKHRVQVTYGARDALSRTHPIKILRQPDSLDNEINKLERVKGDTPWGDLYEITLLTIEDPSHFESFFLEEGVVLLRIESDGNEIFRRHDYELPPKAVSNQKKQRCKTAE